MPTALQVIKDHYAASERGDVEAMLAPLAADAHWTEMAGFPCAGTYVGAEAVKENVFIKLAATWDDYQALMTDFVADDTNVVAFGYYTGTYKATGKPMKVRVAHHWTVEDGKIVRFEQYTDTKLVDEAMQP